MVFIAIILLTVFSILLSSCITKVKNCFPNHQVTLKNPKNLTTSYVTGDQI